MHSGRYKAVGEGGLRVRALKNHLPVSPLSALTESHANLCSAKNAQLAISRRLTLNGTTGVSSALLIRRRNLSCSGVIFLFFLPPYFLRP